VRSRPLAICLLIVALGLALAGVARAQPGPSPIYGSPGISPPGANDFSCRPSSQHPRPVVLVHGTFGDMTVSWNLISPALARRGYCVFALDYGNRGTGRIEDSAAQLRDFVNKVLKATGAGKVSIVGHSQGGMMPRYYIKFLGGAAKVDDLVGLAPSNHGTTTPLAPPAGQYASCPACTQQVAGSSFLRHLNGGDETPGLVSYTQVETSHDEVVTPYSSAFLKPGPRTTNVLLQDNCPLDLSEHLGIIYDRVALQWVENALGRPGPAVPGFRPTCL
jgi:triacylglycerol lipase